MKPVFSALAALAVALSMWLPARSGQAQTLEDIQWVTEEYPPMNYQENGFAKGIAVEIVMEMWKKVGLNKAASDIKFYPWARGYAMAQEQKNVCLFITSITEPRKALFKFVGPYKGSDVGIIARKGRLHLASLDDVKKLKIGVKRDDIGEKLLVDTGETFDLYPVVQGNQLIGMLHRDRVAAVSLGFYSAVWEMKKAGLDPAHYEMAYVLRANQPTGFAFSKDIDPKLIERLQKAYDELLADGTVERIKTKYLSK